MGLEEEEEEEEEESFLSKHFLCAIFAIFVLLLLLSFKKATKKGYRKMQRFVRHRPFPTQHQLEIVSKNLGFFASQKKKEQQQNQEQFHSSAFPNVVATATGEVAALREEDGMQVTKGFNDGPRSGEENKSAKRPLIDEKRHESINVRIDRCLSLQRGINAEVGYNLFDNEGWREWGIAEVLQENGYDSFKILHSRVGRDAECPCHNLSQIEIKTSKVKQGAKRLKAHHGFAEFCRQNTLKGMETAQDGYDGLVIAVFQELQRQPLLIVFMRTEQGLDAFREIIIEKQEEYKQKAEFQQSSMVNGRDSIRISLSDIYQTIPSDRYELYFRGERIDGQEKQHFIHRLQSAEGVWLAEE